MKTLVVSIVLAGIAFVFIGTGFFLYQKSQESPVEYSTTSPFTTDIVSKTVATGRIIPRKQVDMKTQVSGVVETIHVRAGDHVERGDLIAKINLIPNMEHLSNAESRLEQARINLRNATRELERQEKLFADRLISESEYNRFVLDFELRTEAVKAAENTVDLIREGASQQSGIVSNLVRSTASGMVLDVPVKEGVFVIETNTFNEGSTIATVADMTDLIFEGRVDESEVGKISEGMNLELTVGAIGNESFDAVLEYISPRGEEDQGTIKFEIRAAVELREDFFLRSGYSANADIILDQRQQVLAINEGNLIFNEQQPYVDVQVGPQQFERRRVQVGLSDGINIEVMSGLDSGEAIKQL